MSNTLRRLDLNLLVTLDALLEEQNTTRVAERLHLSQPTVSAQLARLREMLDDPLLLPGPRGMLATARAEALREPLRQALAGLQQAVAPARVFDPSEATNSWRVSASDYGECTVLLPALSRLRDQAPGTTLAITELNPPTLGRQLERGEIDLTVSSDTCKHLGLHRQKLFSERYVLAARRGHPGLHQAPSLEQFCQLEHVLVSPNGGGFYGITDAVLAELGVQRRVVLSLSHFLFLTQAVAETDMVAMMPQRLAHADERLQALEAPVSIPGFEMLLVWHERVHRDPAQQWLRAQIAGVVAGMVAGEA